VPEQAWAWQWMVHPISKTLEVLNLSGCSDPCLSDHLFESCQTSIVLPPFSDHFIDGFIASVYRMATIEERAPGQKVTRSLQLLDRGNGNDWRPSNCRLSGNGGIC
jgi:hypothetical protein